MKFLYTLAVVLFFYFWGVIFTSSLQAQTVLTVGLSKYTTQLRTIIETEGYNIKNVDYKDISTISLRNKEALTLFNLRQTWNQEQIFTPTQVEAILAFVREGGTLYLTSRKGYHNLLLSLGVEISGVDGNQTGREWSLISEPITTFATHPLTHQLRSIKTDVSARFEVNSEWTVLGSSSEQVPLLAVRKWGLGKVILGSGERIFRDPRPTSNRYETDISMGSNLQYHINLFAYLSNDFVASSTTSSSVTLEKEAIRIFPNPTTQMLYVQGNNIQQLEIISTNGQLLKTFFTKEETASIDLSLFPKGAYWLRIYTQSQTITKEIILN